MAKKRSGTGVRFDRLQTLLEKGGTKPRILNYGLWLDGTNKLTIKQKTPPEFKQKILYGMVPFSEPVATGAAKAHKAATITVMSDNARLALGLSDANLNYKSQAADFEDLGGYFPALARIKGVVTSAVAQDRVSDITKDTYKKKPSMSFSIPFGRTTSTAIVAGVATIGNALEEKVADGIASAVKGKAIGQGLIASTISFLPEEVKEGNKKSAKPTSGLPTSLPPIT